MSFTEEHELSVEEQEFLHAVGQLAGQALERARLFEAVQTSDEQLRAALIAGHAAPWRVDLVTMTTVRDPAYCALLGLRDQNGLADFESIHPDDRAAMKAAFERTLRDGTPFEPEARVRRGDGSFMWVRSHARLTRKPDGMPAVLAGVMVDIDEAKRSSLRADEERRINETLHRLGASFASELEHDRLVQLITDEVTKLVGAAVGCFVAFPDGQIPAEIAASSSQLTVPVVARSGEGFGKLLFGHPEVNHFTAEHDRLATSIAGQAAVSLENARLYKTVREQKDQLELAVERARLADRRKDEFLAMLGHELRNPLAPIATALELMSLKEKDTLRPERDVIQRQVNHLSRLVDDLLDVSRITRGKVQLQREVLEISAVLAKAIEMSSPIFEKRMQRLALDVPREGLLVDADPTRLAQVFQNLLTNASKYSETGTQVDLRARVQADRIVVEVRDRGIGISAELMPNLFDLFVQGQRTLDQSEGGLGIGLTIAKSLCELHDGVIEAASAGVGQGSTMTVRLPRAARASVPVVLAGAMMPRKMSGKRVLVVDDNVDAALMLHEFLASMGHQAAVAHDAVAALELATKFQPDIAVLDIGLPVMDGYELARKLREQLGRASLRLIAVTGYGQDSDRVRARAAGFDHHLVKPIELHALLPLLSARN